MPSHGKGHKFEPCTAHHRMPEATLAVAFSCARNCATDKFSGTSAHLPVMKPGHHLRLRGPTRGTGLTCLDPCNRLLRGYPWIAHCFRSSHTIAAGWFTPPTAETNRTNRPRCQHFT